MNNRRNKLFFKGFFNLFLFGAIVVFINYLSSIVFFRLDITDDKRYTISMASKKILQQLDDQVTVEVYLDGDLPAGFKRLRQSTIEILDEIKYLSDGNVIVRFVNPIIKGDAKRQNQLYNQMVKKGLQPTNLTYQEDGKVSEKMIFPSALVIYGSNEVPVQLLKGNMAASPEEQLNQSVEGIEFEIVSAIKRVTDTKRKKIAFITGHGEQDDATFNDIGLMLRADYDLQKVDLPKKVSLDGFDAAIIVKPDSAFSEPDKYKIDQFMVRGGAVAFFIDQAFIDIDSLGIDGSLAFSRNLNLDDFFFNLGFKFNHDLLLDASSAYIPMYVGQAGNQAQTKLMPWYYYPLLTPFAKHPITKSLNAVYSRFSSTIINTDEATNNGLTLPDSVGAKKVAKSVLIKTPLLLSSPYRRAVGLPIRVDFDQIRKLVPPKQPAPPLVTAWLAQGYVQSLYTNRLAPHTIKQFEFIDKDKPTKIMVAADGDIVLGEINKKNRTTYPAGFDRFSGIQFGNRDFVQRIFAFFFDDEGLILSRTKSVKLRPLDTIKARNEKLFWQWLNIGFPILLIAIMGFTVLTIRRKYAVVK